MPSATETPHNLVPLGKPLLDTLERMGCGGLVLDASGEILQTNPTAERLLGDGLVRGNHAGRSARNALKRLLAAGTTRFTTVQRDAWVVIPREDARELILHAVRLTDARVLAGPHTIVILVDLDVSPQPAAATLQKLFGLTSAEARLAARIATGATLAEITDESGISVSTARSQLASIFLKTHTRRQGELVALLARVALLP